MRAAQYLNCTPWELMERPAIWHHWAIAAISAENNASQGPKKTSAASAAEFL